MTPTTIETVVSVFSYVLTWSLGIMLDVIDAVVANPALLIFTLVGIVGAVIGWAFGLIHF